MPVKCQWSQFWWSEKDYCGLSWYLKKVGFKLGLVEWRSYRWQEWWIDGERQDDKSRRCRETGARLRTRNWSWFQRQGNVATHTPPLELLAGWTHLTSNLNTSRRLRRDATNTVQWHHCNNTNMLLYGPLWENTTSSIKLEVTYCIAARGGPSHGHR